MKFLQCKKWQISALSMLSWCQKYAQNWWGVIFTKSHTTALTRASLISSFILSATNEAQTFWFAWSAKKKEKEMSLILWKVALLSSTLENTIGMHATTPGTVFCANLFPISYQSPKRLRICCPENNVVLPWNMSLMITFGNKLQDMLTTVADSIYPHQMLRLTFWDQFQSHVN